MKNIICFTLVIGMVFLSFLVLKPSEQSPTEKETEVGEFQSQINEWVEKEDRKIQGQITNQTIELVTEKTTKGPQSDLSSTEVASIPSR